MNAKFFRGILIGSFVAAACFGSSAHSADAAVRCSSASCKGKNPAKMRCEGDAKTVATAHGSFLKVELRYSKRCEAYWSRATILDRTLVDEAVLNAWMGDGSVTTVEAEKRRVIWSLMWHGRIDACGELSYGLINEAMCANAP